MTININEQYKIIGDTLNYTLQKSRVPKEGKNAGKTLWKSITWHPTLESAYKGAIREQVTTADLEGVSEIINKLDAIHKDIEESIASIEGA